MSTLALPSVRERRGPRGLGSGIAISVVVHALIIAGVVWLGRGDLRPLPPTYRVRLVGAPPGPRAAGVVNAATAPPSAPPREIAGAERVPDPPKAAPNRAKSLPKVAPKATPSLAKARDAAAKAPPVTTPRPTTAPRAGAGAEGGKGADVANVDLKGVAFPYPAYLDRIMRQLTLEWKPRRSSSALETEVRFIIQRDGTVTAIEVVKRSGDGIYDLDAMGAVEAVGSVKGFGPLPAGWQDDALVVYFTFDYALRPNR